MTTPAQEITIGRIVRVGALESALPLEHTEVTAQLSGPLASVAVRQRFGNPLAEAAELEYLFPLPAGAAVTGFDLRLGNRLIRGKIEEIERARQEYAAARDEGRRAGLLEQRRPNLFAIQLANLLPGETVLAEMRYQERVAFNQDGYEFVFPMGLTPRYDRPGHAEEGGGVHAPVARPGEPVGTVELSVAVDTGLPCGEPSSPSHPLEVMRMDARRLQVRLAGEHIPDHDFVLRLPAAGDLPGAAAWASPAADGAYFMAAILPPRASSEPLQVPREFIFVLDRSGSMSGGPILQARNALRACLRALNPDDTFRVLLFDDQLEWYQPEPSAVTQAAVDRADAFLNRVDARGGTEIIGALEAALSLPPDPRRTRLVVFLTDGAVSAEAAALEALGRRLGAARVFTFGIGPSVNRALLARMARLGKGASEFLQADEDIEGAVIRFQDRVSFPVLTDLALHWEGGNAWDIYPARLPDLYMGQALEFCGRLRPANGPARLLVSGKRGDERFEQLLELAVPAQPDEALGRVWARARVDDLLEDAALDPRRSDALRAAVIGLALEHRLVTPYTAFAALDETAATAGGKPVLIKVSQPLPQGLDFGVDMLQSFASAAPMMPMPVAPAAAPLRSAKMAPAGRGKSLWQRALGQAASKPEFEAMDGAAPLAEMPGVYASGRGREEILRELARTQLLDGSWGGEVEQTAAALLAFVRAGHTATAGSFRQAVRRAAGWLAGQPASGFAAQARARALRELAERGGDAKLRAAADAAEQGLPALDPFPAGVTRAADLETLRLASLLRIQVEIDPGLENSAAGQAWAAALM